MLVREKFSDCLAVRNCLPSHAAILSMSSKRILASSALCVMEAQRITTNHQREKDYEVDITIDLEWY